MQINFDTNVYFIFSVLLIAFFMREPVSLVQCITKMALIATLWTNFTFFICFTYKLIVLKIWHCLMITLKVHFWLIGMEKS